MHQSRVGHSDFQPPFHGASFRHAQWVRQVRRSSVSVASESFPVVIEKAVDDFSGISRLGTSPRWTAMVGDRSFVQTKDSILTVVVSGVEW